MGAAIARNIAKAGRNVMGYDIDPARMNEVSGDGVKVAANIAELAQSCEIVLTSLPSDKALDSVVTDLVAAAQRPQIVVELSTLALSTKTKAQQRLSYAHIAMLDCPISGTGAQAKTRDLVVFASGDAGAVNRCAPIFEAFAKASPHVGAFGHGTKFKLIANLLVAIHNVSTAEALAMGRKAGLDLDAMLKVIGPGAGGSRMFDIRGPLMAAGTFEPATMKLDVWQKDMALIAEFAGELGAATPLFDATKPLYDAALAEGGGRDTAAVFDVIAKK